MAMVHSKKKKRIEEVFHGVKVSTWLKSVQEAAFVLGKIETDVVTSPRARSRSILRAKWLALEIRALPKNANLDSLFADSPKGERNRNPYEGHWIDSWSSVGFRFRSPFGESASKLSRLEFLGSALISRANNLALRIDRDLALGDVTTSVSIFPKTNAAS